MRIADAIVALARDPVRRAALGAAGRCARRQFDLPQAAAALPSCAATAGCWRMVAPGVRADPIYGPTIDPGSGADADG